jgi:hypothetical protein
MDGLFSSDFVALLDRLDTAERARPLVAVLDNGPIHRRQLTARAQAGHRARLEPKQSDLREIRGGSHRVSAPTLKPVGCGETG